MHVDEVSHLQKESFEYLQASPKYKHFRFKWNKRLRGDLRISTI